MEGHLLMSKPERERLKVFERVKRRELSLREAAALCGRSYRQTRFGASGPRADMVWSPSHGDGLTVPLLDEFMCRIIPGDNWKISRKMRYQQ